MMNLISVFVVFALFVIFPAFIFILLVRAIRIPGTRWWGIVILLSILTCYCTTMVGVTGLIVGGNATGSVALEQRYCEQFREVLTQTETLPEAIGRMDVAAASDEYQIKEPEKNLRFRFVWILGGCFLFAGANLMMFGPGRRERRHPTDCLVMIVAALVVFLTGVWQIAWGNGYAFQAAAYRGLLTEWHAEIPLDSIHASNAEIAEKFTDEGVRGLNGLWRLFLELSGGKTPGMAGKREAGTGAPGIAVIGGADGPTAVFISSELQKKLDNASAGSETEAVQSEAAEPGAAESPAAEENVPD